MSNSEPAEKKLKTGEDCIVVSASSGYGCKVAPMSMSYASCMLTMCMVNTHRHGMYIYNMDVRGVQKIEFCPGMGIASDIVLTCSSCIETMKRA